MGFLTVRSVYGAVMGEYQKAMRVHRAERMALLDVSMALLGAGNRGLSCLRKWVFDGVCSLRAVDRWGTPYAKPQG